MGPANTTLKPAEGLNASSSTSAVFIVTEQQQNTTSLANELQTGITEIFSGWVATNGPRVVHQIVPVFLYVPRGRLQTHALLDEGSNASLMEQDLATELGLSGSKSKLVFSEVLIWMVS